MTTSSLPGPIENGLAAAKIAERGGPNAVGTLVTIMDASARDAERIEGLVRRGIERERDEWRDRALDAEERLARIEDRVWELFR